uniref:Uncharacterized protein n=1 Tax=Pyxicephalus adspersus TaxID=30357 RepID=A0AAV3B377_PYXAD|nr:TPA: hypothetical protein GDO54_007782 [Pyxicephalus adspersus]
MLLIDASSLVSPTTKVIIVSKGSMKSNDGVQGAGTRSTSSGEPVKKHMDCEMLQFSDFPVQFAFTMTMRVLDSQSWNGEKHFYPLTYS